MTLPPDDPPRIVTPRKRVPTRYLPIIALGRDRVLIEESGAVYPAEAFPAILAAQTSSVMLACQDFGPHLHRLREAYLDDPLFNYRVTPREQYPRLNYSERQPRVSHITDAVCNFVGWKRTSNHKSSRYHYPLDPIHFVRASIDELKPGETLRIYRLLEWAEEVRSWCLQEGLQVKPSSGGLVAQLLCDPRFYPQPRRKVPGLVNDSARLRLPGNYYHLHAAQRTHEHALYLDMSAAHHNIAAETEFPCANTLSAYGNWRDTDGRKPRLFARDTEATALLRFPGLFHLRVSVPHIHRSRFPIPGLTDQGLRDVWLFSNELELAREHRVDIRGIIAALISDTTEDGLNRYSRWALRQLADNPSLKPWLKPTLHSTYGVLAARPVPFETAYLRANGGTPTAYPMGSVDIPGRAVRTTRAVESRLANVIHRGMIEAGVRLTVCRMAANLTAHGMEIIAAYGDALFVLDHGEPLPLLPPPWRVAAELTDIHFIDSTHFVSNELTRLPGCARDRTYDDDQNRLRQRAALINSIRAQINRSKGGSSAAKQEGHEGAGASASGRAGR